MEFKDEDGNVLSLEESEEGIWMSGSYYDYLMGVVDTSLNNYLTDNGLGADYIKELNKEAGEEWITYDQSSGTASVSDMENFVTNWKPATKEVGAFDDLSGTQPENHLFGNDESDVSHFDSIMAQQLGEHADEYAAYDNWDASYTDAYAEGIKTLDKLGTDMDTRQDMYNPLYFLSEKKDGYGTSDVASYWRINTGLMQGDTSLTTEVDLYLSVLQMDGVDAQFTTVWDQPHVEAERTGDYTENFIDWVFDSLENDTERTVRESGVGEPSVVKSASKAGNASQYAIAEGYDLYEEFEHYFEGMDQNITILASLSSDRTKMNLQFDFFEDKQDVSLEYKNKEWVVTEDASGFMSQDGPVIANEAMEKDGWQTAEALESQYESAVGYEMYEVFEYYFEDMDQTVVVMASTNTVQTKMNLQFDFFEDKQDVSLEYKNDEWVVTEDASGFMSKEGPMIAQAAMDFNGWQVK